MKKKKLLEQLHANTLVMIKPSLVDGIGVFALTDIKKGQRRLFSDDKSEWIKISREEVEQLPQHSKALIENFCLYDDDHYFVPEYGFKMVDLVIYLNHSDTPNVMSVNEGEDFEALRDIREGEELFVDYGAIVDSH
jgi:SET domain-containing protein